MNSQIMCILYAVVVMVIVSLDSVYGLTYKLFGGLVGSGTQDDYATGMQLNEPGFIIHVIVFALLLSLPLFMKKYGLPKMNMF